MFAGLKSGLSKVGQSVSKGVDSVGNKINQAIDERTYLLKYFRSGNVVQLISRSTGKTVQLVTVNGKSTLNALGEEGETNKQACWSVTNDGNHVVLYIDKHYITVADGSVRVVEFDDASKVGIEAKFHLTQHGQFVCLESAAEKGRHLGFIATGELKPALACGKENDGQFGGRLISSPYKDEKEESSETKEGATKEGATTEAK